MLLGNHDRDMREPLLGAGNNALNQSAEMGERI